MNAVDYLFYCLTAEGFVPEEDIAWVGVSKDNFLELDIVSEYDNFRHYEYKIYQNVLIRISDGAKYVPMNNFGLRGRVAWNITKRTKKFFDWPEIKQNAKN